MQFYCNWFEYTLCFLKNDKRLKWHGKTKLWWIIEFTPSTTLTFHNLSRQKKLEKGSCLFPHSSFCPTKNPRLRYQDLTKHTQFFPTHLFIHDNINIYKKFFWSSVFKIILYMQRLWLHALRNKIIFVIYIMLS